MVILVSLSVRKKHFFTNPGNRSHYRTLRNRPESGEKKTFDCMEEGWLQKLGEQGPIFIGYLNRIIQPTFTL